MVLTNSSFWYMQRITFSYNYHDALSPLLSSMRHSTLLTNNPSIFPASGLTTVNLVASSLLLTLFSNLSTKKTNLVVNTNPTILFTSVVIQSSRLQRRICFRISTNLSAWRMSMATGLPLSAIIRFKSRKLMLSFATTRRSRPATPIFSPRSLVRRWMNCISVRQREQSTVTTAVSAQFRRAQYTREALPDWAGPTTIKVLPMSEVLMMSLLASPRATIHSFTLYTSSKAATNFTSGSSPPIFSSIRPLDSASEEEQISSTWCCCSRRLRIELSTQYK